MKKIILSSLLILSFSLYVFYKRTASLQENLPIAVPSTFSSNNKPTPSPYLRTIPTGIAASSESINHPVKNPVTPQPTSTPLPTRAVAGAFKDGSYTGTEADAFYGYLQVQAVITGGKLTDVVFLRFPNDRDRSIFINQQALPYLKQEAITAQSASVNIVSGATDSSEAFRQSLSSALAQAKS
jgi:uncharacterized protein with FMN-binding domain